LYHFSSVLSIAKSAVTDILCAIADKYAPVLHKNVDNVAEKNQCYQHGYKGIMRKISPAAANNKASGFKAKY